MLPNQDEMSNIYRGPSIYASYQVVGSFGQAVWEEKILEIGQPETRISCDAHFYLRIDPAQYNLNVLSALDTHNKSISEAR